MSVLRPARRLAVAAVSAGLMFVVASTPPAGAAIGDVGVLGCSNTAIATIGYHQVSDVGRLWFASTEDNPLADYWGQDIVAWADENGQGQKAWAAFDALVTANPQTSSVWFQVCVRADSPGSTATVDTIVDLIRDRLPAATIYASALDDTPSCMVGDPETSQTYVDHLVDTGQAVRGPTMSPLPADQVKGCHASGDGLILHGTDLASYFDDGVTPGQPSTGFADVPDSHVFADDIVWLANSGITRGCNPPDNDLFCPDDPVTRGQMAAFLTRALDMPPSATDVFTDDDTSVFEADIQALAAAGITTGCDGEMFCPDDPVTRAQMATFIVNGYGWTKGAGDDLFVDDDTSVHESDIDVLGTVGVTLGCNPPANDRYCPDNPVTRGEMAAFLHRASNSS